MRTLDEVTEGYFRDHPEEIDDYLTEIFQDFAEDNDTGVLLASLRVLARVRGVGDMAAQIGMTRQGLQKALSDDGNPRLSNVTSIVKAIDLLRKYQAIAVADGKPFACCDDKYSS